MRKLDLATWVRDQVGGMSKREIRLLVNTLIGTIEQAVTRGESVKVAGFGSFLVRQKRQRMGRNPKTGKAQAIPARRVLTFRPSPLLREAMNS